jgi:predicted site-specific integrase-resolvase
MERKLVKIGEAAALVGSTPATLRKWEETGELLLARKTKGGTRYYAVADLLALGDADAPTVCYARVSSHDQKADLDRRHERLQAYCAAKGWRTEVIRDLGSGMNYRKKGLQRLLEMILRRQRRRLVITPKEIGGCGLALNWSSRSARSRESRSSSFIKADQPSFEEELAQDVLEIITVFSARLYGSRSKKHRKRLEDLQTSAEAIAEELGVHAPRPQD